jgi:V/A-type H+-transporting ATPase subunit E
MGIEKLRGSLLSEANDEAARIINEAKNQAAHLLEEERKGQEEIGARAETEVEQMIAEERNERLAWARLEAKRIMAESEEDAIKGVMEELIEALSSMHGSAEYKEFMKSAISKASEELGGNVVVRVTKGEKSLVPKGKGMKVEDDLDALGGAIVETADGRIRINLTLETLLDTRRDDLRKQIYQKLFGGK